MGVQNLESFFLGDLCLNFKYLVLLIKMTVKNEIVQAIFSHELIGKRKDAMDRLCHGLERFQVLESIPKNSTVFEPVFVHMEEQEPFISVFEIDESVLDEQTQNNHIYQKPTQQRNGGFYSFQLVQP